MISCKVTLTIQGPLLTRATAIAGFGIDSPVARDRNNVPLIAGTHLIGKLREAWEQLRTIAGFAETAVNLFGDKGEQRKLVEAGDLRALTPESHEAPRARIAIDPLFGRALDGAVQFMEVPYASGEHIEFVGELRIHLPDAEAAALCVKLDTALAYVGQFGGERSIGFGRLLASRICPKPPRAAATICPLGQGPARHWRLVLRLRDPFGTGRRTAKENIYTTDEFIPGSLIKGALATHIATSNHSGTLQPKASGDAFSALKFSHALPMASEIPNSPAHFTALNKAPPPAPRPASLATAGGKWFDAATVPTPFLFSPVAGDPFEAPAFAPDFKKKDEDCVDILYPAATPRKILRVRTKINAGTKSAEPEKLFGIEMLEPDRIVFVSSVDLGTDVPADQTARLEELNTLLAHGLGALGISKAGADAWLLPHVPAAVPQIQPGQRVRIVLASSALLLDPVALAGTGNMPREQATRDLYQLALREAIGCNDLALHQVFADERLAGGVGDLRRRLAAATGFVNYTPWIETLAGSTFVVTCTSPQGTLALAMAAKNGLDLSLSLVQNVTGHRVKRETLWKWTVMVRENGFGAIVLDPPDPVHADFVSLAGVPGQIKAIP